MCLAIRKVQTIGQIVVLVLQTNHLQQVNISRTSTSDTVYCGVTGQQVVDQQGIRSRDITMDGIVVDTISVGIVVVAAGRTYLVVEYPCVGVVSLDSRLHQQCTTQHVGDVTIQTLYIL